MVKAQRRALNRKAWRARWRRQVRHALAELRREYGATAVEAELFRLEHACPCGECDFRGEERRPVWFAELPAEVRAAHDAHTARLIQMWQLRVWAPEEAAALRRVLLPLLVSTWSRTRKALMAAGLIRGDRRENGWPLSDPGEISALFAYRSETWVPPGALALRAMAGRGP